MAKANGEKEFAFNQSDFNSVRKRLYEVSGIKLADSKDSMVYSRLARRLRLLNISSFKDYLSFLSVNESELEAFVNALTTNLTSFYRESYHFDILANYLSKNQRPLKIWCAASSTGEEPYSIAMTVAESFARFDAPVKIIASDIDSQVLQKAQQGIYPIKMLDSIPDARRKQFFHRGKGRQEGKVRVVPELRQMVTFRKINLMDAHWDVDKDLDIIFCRNVMIYFDKPTQGKIVEKMVGKMNKDGLYFAGHSENFSHLSSSLKPMGKTVYQPVKG